MFELTRNPIKHSYEIQKLNNPAAGGIVFFEGRVRNHNKGYRVKSLEYQCYESMAVKEGKKIIQEALHKFDIHHAKCIHRHGHLNISDVAVWVGVASSHRKEAFHACQYIIDEVKSLLPIWKKEYYIGKNAQWVACHNCKTDSDHKQNNHE